MTRDEALSLLELPGSAGAAEIRDHVRERYSEYQLRLDNSPTTNLKLTYQKKIAELQEAGELLLGDDAWLDERRDLPVSEPSREESGGGRSSLAPLAAQSSATARQERDCPACAERIMANATRCRWCGQPVAPLAAEEPGKPVEDVTSPRPKRKSRSSRAIVLAFVVLLAVVAALFVKLGPTPSATNRANEDSVALAGAPPPTPTATNRVSDDLVTPSGPMKFTTLSNSKNASLNSVWGSSASDVWAVGGAGPLLHYDGTQWSRVTRESKNYLLAVWGSSASDVWASGDGGTLLHYDGSRWSSVSSGTKSWLYTVWGSSGADVWAVGQAGTLIHYDGSTWAGVSSGTTKDLYRVWGSSPSDVWASGLLGTLLHYDGKSWSSVFGGTRINVRGLWGSSASDVWASGDEGMLLHYDGKRWRSVRSRTTMSLYCVWGTSASDVWASGQGGTLLHYDGTRWASVPSGNDSSSLCLWGSSATDLWAVGDGTILHGKPVV